MSENSGKMFFKNVKNILNQFTSEDKKEKKCMFCCMYVCMYVLN